VQPSDFARFRAVLTGMAEMYQREVSPALLDAYWLALRSWSLPDFEAAAGRLLATATFMPRPADFTGLRKAAQMTAAEAWDAAIAACPGWRYGTAKVTPLVDRVVRMLGGYERLAMEPLDTQHFTRNKFIEFYESAGDAEETRAALPTLTVPQILERAEAARKLGHEGLP
jgi:hypothetical protein